jgi:hypothetical protein
MNTKRVSVRDLRRNLAQFLSGTEAVSIGDYYNLRAIIVPVQAYGYDNASRAKAMRAAKKSFAALATREHPRSGSPLR